MLAGEEAHVFGWFGGSSLICICGKSLKCCEWISTSLNYFERANNEGTGAVFRPLAFTNKRNYSIINIMLHVVRRLALQVMKIIQKKRKRRRNIYYGRYANERDASFIVPRGLVSNIYLHIHHMQSEEREQIAHIVVVPQSNVCVPFSNFWATATHVKRCCAGSAFATTWQNSNGIFICVAFNRWYCFPSGFFGRVNNPRWMNPKLLDASLEYQSLILFEWTVSSPWLNSEGHSKQPNGDDNAKTNSITMWSSSLSKILVYQ